MSETPWPRWFTPRLPQAHECSPGLRLIELAEEAPDAAFLVHPDGKAETRAQVLDAARLLAGRLAAQGLKGGDFLLVWLPTGPELVRTIFACSLLGATIVPLNTSMRGDLLAHMIRIAAVNLMICHAGLVERLAELDGIPGVDHVIVPGEDAPVLPGCRVSAEAALRAAPFEPALNRPWDIAAIIFSSGTTGPSKGVRVPAAQLWSLANVFYGYMDASDRMLLMYPLFHIAGMSAFYAVLNVGASMAVTEAFSATRFWDMLRVTGSTTTPGLGPTFVSILEKPEPSPADRDNPLRHVFFQKVSAQSRAFAERFGCSYHAGYGMSEASGICISAVNETKDGIVGRPRSGIEVRVVDEYDVEVPHGTPGELIFRAAFPWTVNDGYQGDDEATRKAWRNGWFHTGDHVVRDEDGDIRFVDRKKDVIRRRSENISSSEVEAVLRQHPAVQDAAAIGIDFAGDQEILAVLSEVPGRRIAPEELVAFLVPKLPHFMVPRFFRILPELPKTHTNRVRKEGLRVQGLTADCWDREAAGLTLRGTRLNA